MRSLLSVYLTYLETRTFESLQRYGAAPPDCRVLDRETLRGHETGDEIAK